MVSKYKHAMLALQFNFTKFDVSNSISITTKGTKNSRTFIWRFAYCVN